MIFLIPKKYIKIIKISLFLLVSSLSFAQENNNILVDSIKNNEREQLKFNYKQLIIPTFLIGYGIIGLESDQLKLINSEVIEEVTENVDKRLTIDDFSDRKSVV